MGRHKDAGYLPLALSLVKAGSPFEPAQGERTVVGTE
jgi:hypothetical protein